MSRLVFINEGVGKKKWEGRKRERERDREEEREIVDELRAKEKHNLLNKIRDS